MNPTTPSSIPPQLPPNTSTTQTSKTQDALSSQSDGQLAILAAVFIALANSVNIGSQAAIARTQGLSGLNAAMTQEETSVASLALEKPTGDNVSVMQSTINNENTMQTQAVANAQMGTLQQDASAGQTTIGEIAQNINGTLSQLTATASIITSVTYSATMSKPPK